MLEVYSLNQTVGSLDPIPFTNVTLKKGCTAELSGTTTIQLNKCGVYMITVDTSSATATTIELYKNCLLYTSDAADDMQCVDLGGRRII